MSGFTRGEPQIATEDTCKAPWFGGKNGIYFRCAFCGYKFKVGDYYRFQYTNNVKGAGGNPLVCKTCDDTPENLIEKWKQMHTDVATKYWWFHRWEND